MFAAPAVTRLFTVGSDHHRMPFAKLAGDFIPHALIDSPPPMQNNRSVSAATGEYLVLGELLKRGVEAYLAHGETQKGWDIVILRDAVFKRVQVKTIDWPQQYPVNGNLTEGFDFLVVVLLDRSNPRSRFFIFPVDVLDSLISVPNEKRVGGKRTLTMSKKAMDAQLASYEDNWAILELVSDKSDDVTWINLSNAMPSDSRVACRPV
ncbi:hypothetical protein [Burkholderia ubonensis]|uniref:hypothetical protein n=1 Tax=Burkholderia ubonensis TaxID=101571 RepID=UPI0018E1A688|nr:hypothetical protein [Burkholderia ubonensis]